MDLSSTLPQTSGSLQLAGLESDAEIVRDRWGIPHIRARTVADAFFAQGFAHAQDRMWQMEWDRRRAYGRTAELLGPARLAADRLARRLQLERAAQADWQLLNDEARAMVESFTAGVNAYLERTPVPSVEFKLIGIGPEAWRPWDCIGLFKFHHALMGLIYNKLWRLKVVLRLGVEKASSLFLDYPAGHPLIVPPDVIYHSRGEWNASLLEEAVQLLPSADASNNWLVDGTLTQSGKPLLAGDPHRAIDAPNVFYQNHLRCDQFDAIGISFPGVPGISHQGHNGRVAWSVTHAQSDYQDLYLERFRTDNPTGRLYEYKGEWHTAAVSEERIQVKGGDAAIERVRCTGHGPIVEDSPWPHHAIAMRYVGIEPGKTFECFLRMLRARTSGELREAQREWVDPGQCLIFADAAGDVGMLMRGRLPIRSGANAWLPVPGWSGAHEWQDYVPFEQLPQLKNPSAHFIVTANNQLVADDYPYHITLDAGAGYRAARIIEMLASLEDTVADDFVAMQADRLSIPARELVPHLLTIEPGDDQSQRALDLLRRWDYRMEPDSVAATLYTATRDALMRLLIEPLFGQELTREMLSGGRGASAHIGRLRSYLATFIQTNDTRLLRLNPLPHMGEDGAGAHDSWPAAMRAALRIALDHLRAQLGPDMSQWQWGRLHRTNVAHPLSVLPEVGERFDPPWVVYGGDGDTVCNAGYAPALGYAIGGVQVYRQVIDLADIAHARWVVPLGASGHPGSPHYADQIETWRANQLIPMLYDWQEIEANAEAKLELKRKA